MADGDPELCVWVARRADPSCEVCRGTWCVLHEKTVCPCQCWLNSGGKRAPTPADLLTDPRVRALVGTRRGTVHRNYGYDSKGRPDRRTGWYNEDMPIYDPAGGDRFRELRASLGLTLGDVSRRTGLSVVDVSGLERDRATCDFAKYEEVLRG